MLYRIMIVDEMPANADQLARILAQTQLPQGVKYEIVSLRSAAAAQIQLRRLQISLVVLPLRPENNTISLMQYITEIHPGLPILVLRQPGAAPFQVQLAQYLGGQIASAESSSSQLQTEVANILAIDVTPADVAESSPAALPSLPRTRLRGMPVLSASQLSTIQRSFLEISRNVGMHYLGLIDLTGQSIAHWSRVQGVVESEVAALAAAELLATMELSRVLGSQHACKLIVQEHDDQTFLLNRVGDGMMLLMAIDQQASIGWARLTIRRAAAQLLEIVDQEPEVATEQVGDDFELQFGLTLDSLLR